MLSVYKENANGSSLLPKTEEDIKRLILFAGEHKIGLITEETAQRHALLPGPMCW